MSSLVLEEDVKTQMCFTSQDKWLELCNDCNEVVLPAICSLSLFPLTDWLKLAHTNLFLAKKLLKKKLQLRHKLNSFL